MTIEMIIQYLRHIVPERKETCNGENLEYVKTLVRLILDDVANSLGIEPAILSRRGMKPVMQKNVRLLASNLTPLSANIQGFHVRRFKKRKMINS